MIAFGAIELIKTGTNFLAKSSQPQPNPNNPWNVFRSVFTQGLGNALGPLGSLISSFTGFGGVNVGWEALQGAIIVNVATNGNLTGLVTGLVGSTSGNILGDLAVTTK